jgi:peptidyl-tRNA hydrolase
VNKEDVADYVLSTFKKEEKEKIEDQYDLLLKYIQEFLSM